MWVVLAGLVLAVGQASAPPATPHLRPAETVSLQQTGVCGGKTYKLELSAGASVRVESFSIDGVTWGAEELARWNGELAVIREDPIVWFECSSRGDVVRVAGASGVADANYVAVTASGGKGRWGGFTRERFQRSLKPNGVEFRR
jgi:hypothetical protein